MDELALTGAAQALKYLEGSVSRAQKRKSEAEAALDAAIALKASPPAALDGENFDVVITQCRAELKEAEDSLLKQSKVLLDYDKNVDTSRREVSETITKKDAQNLAFFFAITMRGCVERLCLRASQEAMEVQRPEDMFMIVTPILRESLNEAMRSAVSEAQIPAWFAESMDAAL